MMSGGVLLKLGWVIIVLVALLIRVEGNHEHQRIGQGINGYQVYWAVLRIVTGGK